MQFYSRFLFAIHTYTHTHWLCIGTFHMIDTDRLDVYRDVYPKLYQVVFFKESVTLKPSFKRHVFCYRQ